MRAVLAWNFATYIAALVLAFGTSVHSVVVPGSVTGLSLALAVVDAVIFFDFACAIVSSAAAACETRGEFDRRRQQRIAEEEMRAHFDRVVGFGCKWLPKLITALPINAVSFFEFDVQFAGSMPPKATGITSFLLALSLLRMPLGLFVHVQKCLDCYLTAKSRGSASKVVTAEFVLRDVPCACFTWHWNACFAVLLIDSSGNGLPPLRTGPMLYDWFHTGAERIASPEFFWDAYIGIALAGRGSTESSNIFSAVLTICVAGIIILFLTTRVVALSDARAVQNRWEARIHDFMCRNLQSPFVPANAAASMKNYVLRWSKDARKNFASDMSLVELMDGNLSRRVEYHRRAARCLSQLSFLQPWDSYSLYPTGLNVWESWRLRCALAKSMRSEIYCVPGQAVVEAGRTEMNDLRYLREGCLEIAEPRISGTREDYSISGSDIQQKISKLKKKIRAGYKARRDHGAKFRKREKKRRSALLQQIRVLKQRQRWQPPQRRDDAVFSADRNKITAGKWICWECLAYFCNGSSRDGSAKKKMATRTLVTACRYVEIVALPCDVLYHCLVDEFPKVLAALRKIAVEEDGGERERRRDVDAKHATQYFSMDEDGGAGSRSEDAESGGDRFDLSEFSPPSSSSSEDEDRDYYAYKKDYRQLYYKEMKRRVKEKRRRKSLEHDMAQRLKINGNVNGVDVDSKKSDADGDEEKQNQAHPETVSVGTNGWSNSLSAPKFDLQAGQVDADRATTANHDARLREWPRSEAIVRVRLEGPSLAAHLAGRTGTRGEWIEKQGRFVVILDGKSKGRAAMRVRVRGENMVIISPSNKERQVNTPQPLPDVYRVGHRQDNGSIVQVVRDQNRNSPGTPDLGYLPRSNKAVDEQFQQNYSREAIDAEYKRYKSNSAVIPKASEFAHMPTNKPPPSRGMLGAFLEQDKSETGSARVSYSDRSLEKTRKKEKEEGEDQPQQEPSETPPIKDPLNLLGGLMKGSLKDKEGKDDGVWTATKHQVVEVSQQTHEKDSSNVVEKKEEELDQSVTSHRVVEMPGQKQESGEEQKRRGVDPKKMRTLLRALHAFPGLEPGDLPLAKGGLVWGISRQGDWWQGQVYEKRNPESAAGKTGIFPGNYVEVVERSGGSRRIELAPVN